MSSARPHKILFSQVAALAKAKRIPVIVAAESYKFSDKNQLDSIVFNELGSPEELVSTNALSASEVAAAAVTTGPAGSSGGTGNADPASLFSFTPQAQAGYCGAAEVETTSSPLPFQVINLRYDVTPMANISVVACETGLIPPTSIPVLLRELRGDGARGVGIGDS